MQRFLADEQATLDLGAELAKACPDALIQLHLEGELGAGKTTLTRGFLRALGHQGKVKSPTYTLVELYQLNQRPLYHFDLYRVSDPGELEFLGLDDYLRDNAICLIEWPQRGSEYLPEADLVIRLSYQKQARQAEIVPLTERGKQICGKLHN